MSFLDFPYKYSKSTVCRRCKAKKLLGKTPRLYIYGIGYVCRSCAIEVLNDLKSNIDKYDSEIKKEKYANYIIAHML